MNNQFDALTMSLAQSVTRRGALKKFDVGIAGMALASFGLANKAEANPASYNKCMKACVKDLMAQGYSKDQATSTCQIRCFPIP